MNEIAEAVSKERERCITTAAQIMRELARDNAIQQAHRGTFPVAQIKIYAENVEREFRAALERRLDSHGEKASADSASRNTTAREG